MSTVSTANTAILFAQHVVDGHDKRGASVGKCVSVKPAHQSDPFMDVA